MPGVLILEAMAQAAGILAVLKSGVRPEDGLILYFVGIDHARFKRPVTPGDQLILNVSLLRQVRGIGKFAAHATVDNVLVTEAELMCTIKEG